ncbi:MAG: hypothetical protein ACOCV2_04045 [Persicimonas sp.]
MSDASRDPADGREPPDDSAQRFYTPAQIAAGSLFGTFLTAFWMVAINYGEVEADGRFSMTLGVGLVAFVAVVSSPWMVEDVVRISDGTWWIHLKASLLVSVLTAPAGYLQQTDRFMALQPEGARPRSSANVLVVGVSFLLIVATTFGCLFLRQWGQVLDTLQ